MSELLQETINAAERVVAGEDSRIRDYLERLLSSPGELQSGEDSERVYLAALLDFIGLHDESVRVLRDAPDAMSRNMEGMLAAAHGQHEQARNILVEALDAATDSPLLRQQILANLAAVSLQAGSVEEAEAWIEAAAAAGQAGSPAVDVLIATVRASIASRRGDLPALRRAAASLKEASKSRLAELGTEHPSGAGHRREHGERRDHGGARGKLRGSPGTRHRRPGGRRLPARGRVRRRPFSG